METFDKQPAEEYMIGIDFVDRLPAGVAISSGAVSAIRVDDGSDATATVLSTPVATISGTQARVLVMAGTHGQDYKITFLVTLASTEKLEEDVLMRVRAI